MNSVLRSLPVYLLSTVVESGRNRLAQRLAEQGLTPTGAATESA